MVIKLSTLLLVFSLFNSLLKVHAQQTKESSNISAQKVLDKDSFEYLVRRCNEKYIGVFSIYIKKDKYYLEVPDSLLSCPIMFFSRVSSASFGTGYQADDLLGKERTLLWNKKGNVLVLQEPNYGLWPMDALNPLYPAIEEVNKPITVSQYEIIARSTSRHSSMIDASSLFVGSDVMSNSSKKIVRVESNSNFFSVVAERNLPALSSTNNAKMVANIPESTKNSVVVVKSIFYILSPKAMVPRLADDRVGYRTVSFADYNGKSERVEIKKVALHWNISKSKPLTVYVDPLTPKKWIAYIIKGIKMWDSPFAKIGLDHAIVVQIGKKEDTDFYLQSAPMAIMFGLRATDEEKRISILSDPRSGEIMQGHIILDLSSINRLQDEYRILEGINDARARKVAFPDEITGDLISRDIARHIGLVLGLQPNLMASASYPVDSLRSAYWLRQKGTTASILDVGGIDYVAQPEDKIDAELLLPRVSPYDDWAISWGYNPLIDKNSTINKIPISQWTDQQLTKNPRLWWKGPDDSENYDPRVQEYDLGDNSLMASAYALQNLQKEMVEYPNWLGEENGALIQDIYSKILSQDGIYQRYIDHVLVLIGGVWQPPLNTPQNNDKAQPVPQHIQKDAMAFLKKYVFTTPSWMLDKSILMKMDPNILRTIQSIQKKVIRTLIEKKSEALERQEMIFGEIYSVSAMFEELHAMVWNSSSLGATIDAYQRTLQSNYVDILIDFYKTQKNRMLSSSLIGERLVRLKEELGTRLQSTTDPATKAHYVGLLFNINNIQQL